MLGEGAHGLHIRTGQKSLGAGIEVQMLVSGEFMKPPRPFSLIVCIYKGECKGGRDSLPLLKRFFRFHRGGDPFFSCQGGMDAVK